jgi:3-oxoacyl-[acyl-carrier protein] reductase
MELGLAGKTALITGGTSGIGLAVARRLGEEGCNIAICGRKQGKLDAALAELNFDKAKGLVADICKPDDVATLVGDVIAAFGRIDIVVSNAGTHLAGRIDEVATDDLIRHFHTKVVGPWELARQVAPHMRRQGGGRFIVIIGQTGKVPQANAIASTITNAAQHAFVKSLSDELAPSRILVNAVCPSRIKSPLTDGLTLYNEVYLGRNLEQQETRWGAEVPLGRWGTAQDIANAVAFLASDRAAFICGANIDVDGGHQRMIV